MLTQTQNPNNLVKLNHDNRYFIKVSVLNFGIDATIDLIENDKRIKIEKELYVYAEIRKQMLIWIKDNRKTLSMIQTIEDCGVQ